MTLFLSVISRAAAGQTAVKKEREAVCRVLEKTAHMYQNFVGEDYELTPLVEPSHSRGDVHLLYWQRKRTSNSVYGSDNCWAIAGGHNVARELVENVCLRGGKLSYIKPVWGQYATVYGTNNRSQVFAWNTTPALDAIHWGQTDDFIIISNKPLLAALFLAALRSAASPALSSKYLAEYLHYGYSITGQTPFEGIRTLSTNRCLVVTNGVVNFEELPGGLHSDLPIEHTAKEGAEALAAALENSMTRTANELGGRPLQLRMSGGKDSRLLLALLRGRDIDFRAVTFGIETDPDVKLASHLLELVHSEGEVRAPRPARGDNIPDRIMATLRESGGIPPSEPHTAQYRGADPARPHEAIMMGQWPLYKGGMAKRMRSTPEQVTNNLLSQGADILQDDVRAEFDSWLLEWAEGLSVNHDLEKLYLFARAFRSGRYLHAHIDQYAASSMISYPISDAEVTAVCDALTMYEKVSEKALFGALQQLWPDVVRVPLDRSKWKFEVGGPNEEFSGAWYEERNASIPAARPKKLTQVKPVISSHSDSAVSEMSRYLVNSPYFELMVRYLAREFVEAIVEAAAGRIVPPPHLSKRVFNKMVWRVCTAEVWISAQWWGGFEG